MLYKKVNWLLSFTGGQTDQWNAMPVEISRWHFNFCQTAQNIICARDSKMNGEEISKIQIEQYQKPSFYIRHCDSHFMSHTKGNQPSVLSENLQKRKEKANLLEKIQTLESEISKIKSENGSLRAKLRLVRTLVPL